MGFLPTWVRIARCRKELRSRSGLLLWCDKLWTTQLLILRLERSATERMKTRTCWDVRAATAVMSSTGADGYSVPQDSRNLARIRRSSYRHYTASAHPSGIRI